MMMIIILAPQWNRRRHCEYIWEDMASPSPCIGFWISLHKWIGKIYSVNNSNKLCQFVLASEKKIMWPKFTFYQNSQSVTLAIKLQLCLWCFEDHSFYENFLWLRLWRSLEDLLAHVDLLWSCLNTIPSSISCLGHSRSIGWRLLRSFNFRFHTCDAISCLWCF